MYAVELVNTRKEASSYVNGQYRPGMEFTDTMTEAIDLATRTIADNNQGYDFAEIMPSARSLNPIAVVAPSGVYTRRYRDNGTYSHREHIACRWDDSPAFDTIHARTAAARELNRLTGK